MGSKVKPHTRSDADISSEQRVSRRSLLALIGIGAAVGAAAVLLPVTRGEAQFFDVFTGDLNLDKAPSKKSAKKLRARLPPRKSTKSR